MIILSLKYFTVQVLQDDLYHVLCDFKKNNFLINTDMYVGTLFESK